jgi:hypothetical protein
MCLSGDQLDGCSSSATADEKIEDDGYDDQRENVGAESNATDDSNDHEQDEEDK